MTDFICEGYFFVTFKGKTEKYMLIKETNT